MVLQLTQMMLKLTQMMLQLTQMMLQLTRLVLQLAKTPGENSAPNVGKMASWRQLGMRQVFSLWRPALLWASYARGICWNLRSEL